MYALISELDENASVQVMHLWRRLHDACGLEGIFNFPDPHFTWFVCGGVQQAPLEALLEVLKDHSEPFQVRASGLGLFPGRSPVLFLPVVKTAPLMALHETIWNQTQPYARKINLYYSPAMWIPHITLALQDLSERNLGCAVEALAFEPIEILSDVNNLALVSQEGDDSGETLARYELFQDGNTK